MHTEMFPINDGSAWLEKALAVLRTGGVVGVPTETVYGLAGDATRADAVAAIYAAKGRPAHNPLIAHVADLEMAERYAVFNDRARKLADTFWPGPLTLVLPLSTDADLAPAVTAGGDSLAVRCPLGPLRDLADALGHPLAAPSANLSGHVSSTSAHHVLSDLQGGIPLILDGGATSLGLESTILDMRGEAPVLLRPGAVDAESLEATLGVSPATTDDQSDRPVAPGQLASHYAPRVPVRLNVLPQDVKQGEAYLGFGQHTLPDHETLSASGNVSEAAEVLYAALRTLDQQRPMAIAIAPIPTEGLGRALADRLQRAAAPRS
ncbi:L-threonylcarbamoyladenylate synthase [Ahrensia marina]|uniref:L-threonylcarbamoyladenylate synthase n=1 Tax=Ahrensia marina TaxID=1514904 RepID=UPI0035D0A7A5